MVRRARGPLAAPEGETWTCATASPTLAGLEAALFRSTPDRLPRGFYAPARTSPNNAKQGGFRDAGKSFVHLLALTCRSMPLDRELALYFGI